MTYSLTSAEVACSCKRHNVCFSVVVFAEMITNPVNSSIKTFPKASLVLHYDSSLRSSL